MNDLNFLVNRYKQLYKDKEIIILGHSLGGLIVNLYSVTYNDVDKIISIGAPGIVMNSVKILYALPIKLVGNFKMKNNFYSKLTSNMEYNLKQKNDPNCVSYMHFKLLKEMFINSVKYLHKNIDKCINLY